MSTCACSIQAAELRLCAVLCAPEGDALPEAFGQTRNIRDS